MKKIFILFIFLIIILLGSGCENFDKNKVLDKYNSTLNKLGESTLTKEIELTGNREFGRDSYVGQYSAKYNNFNGEEVLFGGTGLNRNNKEFILTYKMLVEGGNFDLVLVDGIDEEIIAQKIITKETKSGTYTYDFSQSDLYIKIIGDEFNGEIEVKIKDSE